MPSRESFQEALGGVVRQTGIRQLELHILARLSSTVILKHLEILRTDLIGQP